MLIKSDIPGNVRTVSMEITGMQTHFVYYVIHNCTIKDQFQQLHLYKQFTK